MVELGGNIKLEGFDDLEPAQLIVVKKVVGNYAKDVSEQNEFSEFIVTLSGNKISVKIVSKDKTIEEEESGDNLFMTLDKALAKAKEAA